MEEKNSKLQANKSRKAGLNHGSMFLHEAYEHFIKTRDNSVSREIKLPEFKKIMIELYDRMADVVIDGKEIALPCNMGNILVNKRVEDNRRPADYGESKKQGKIILEYNSHTDGYRFSIRWRKGRPAAAILNGYQFKASRLLARELAKRLKNGGGYRYQSLSNRKVDKYEV